MPSVRLTRRNVDQLPAYDRVTYVFDTELGGFFLRISPGGGKAWGFQYRVGSGRNAQKKRVTIAGFGSLTPEEARKAARLLAADVVQGRDPADVKARKSREMKVAGLVDLYESIGCVVQRGMRLGEPMKPLTKKYTLSRLRAHVVPLLGTKRVTEVFPADIERLARDIAAGKTARDIKTGPRTRIMVRGGEGIARKVVRDVSALYTFALRQRLAKENPVTNAAVRKTDNQRIRFLSLEEVSRLGAALDELEAAGANPKAMNITRLWALTGCRRNEIASLRWTEIDFERGLLVLDNSKTGKSVRPLGAPALALLSSIAKEAESPFVFPATYGWGFFVGTKDIWPKVTKAAGLPGITPHTLRHTMGGHATSTGEALALTGAILGHANARSTSIYAHVAYDPAKRAADRVSRDIANALCSIISPKQQNYTVLDLTEKDDMGASNSRQQGRTRCNALPNWRQRRRDLRPTLPRC